MLKKWESDGKDVLIIKAIKDVLIKTELTFDCAWDKEDVKDGKLTVCSCGVPKCRGFIQKNSNK